MTDSTRSAADTAFDAWAEQFAARWVRQNPQLATTMQYFSGDEQAALDGELSLAGAYGGIIGATSAQRRAELARTGMVELGAHPRAALGPPQRVSAAVIEHRLRDAIESERDAANLLVFNQFGGLHVSLVSFLTTLHPLRDRTDAQHYLERLAHVAGVLDDGIRDASEAAESRGVAPPAFILERALAQLDGLIAQGPHDHVLVGTLRKGLDAMPGADAAGRETMLARAEALVANEILPALARVRALLDEQRALPGAAAAGAPTLPHYERFYRQALRAYTGSTMSPEEIHAIGLAEVARIESEMDVLLKRLGYRDGTTSERVTQLNVTLAHPDTDEARAGIVRELREIVGDAVRRSSAYFSLLPKAPVTVEREPAHTEATAAAHYTVPAADGSKPGIYWVPLADLGPGVPWLGIGMKSTAYHEAVPGHHFQFGIEQEAVALPHFRKRMAFGYDASYSEGWALYSEHLAAEFDWYGDDLVGRLGYLQMQLFRARRLVVDTGLHAFGWTRQRALDYGLSVPEVERYIVWPGQACSYMIGQRRILAIREHARAALGERFSLAAFHDTVLAGGTLPLDVLAGVVDEWVATG